MGDVLAAALVLAQAAEGKPDAAAEGKKVILAMLVTGLLLAAPALLGETYNYLKYHRRGRSPHWGRR